MSGNYFLPLFSVFKNNFLFLKLKNLFGNPKWIKVNLLWLIVKVWETKTLYGISQMD